MVNNTQDYLSHLNILIIRQYQVKKNYKKKKLFKNKNNNKY